MQFTHIATITTKLGQMPELLRKPETELLPLYRELPGFVTLTVAKTAEAKALAFGIWQTREQAEQAIKTIDKMMKDEIGILVDETHIQIDDLALLAVQLDLLTYVSGLPH